MEEREKKNSLSDSVVSLLQPGRCCEQTVSCACAGTSFGHISTLSCSGFPHTPFLHRRKRDADHFIPPTFLIG